MCKFVALTFKEAPTRLSISQSLSKYIFMFVNCCLFLVLSLNRPTIDVSDTERALFISLRSPSDMFSFHTLKIELICEFMCILYVSCYGFSSTLWWIPKINPMLNKIRDFTTSLSRLLSFFTFSRELSRVHEAVNFVLIHIWKYYQPNAFYLRLPHVSMYLHGGDGEKRMKPHQKEIPLENIFALTVSSCYVVKSARLR